jgi:3-hydroxybutyryl-CoA dehydrogenase
MKKVIVIGAGTMGSGIATWFAQQQINVELFDINTELLKSAQKKTLSLWDKLQAKGKFSQEQKNTYIDCFSIATNLESLDPQAELVIEAIVEKLNPKIEIFTTLHKFINENCLFATNTSGLSVEVIKSNLPKSRQKNFIGLHFFNPATIMKLVEVVTSKHQQNIASQLKDFFILKKKVPVACKDRPGFICNRIARNFYGESFRIAGSYDKEIFKEVDFIMRNVGGFKMGPFELMDLIGIDINFAATTNVYESFGSHPRFAPHSIQQEMVASGKLGTKSGDCFLMGEKKTIVSFSQRILLCQVVKNVDEKIEDEAELVLDLSQASIDNKIKFYNDLQSKNKKIVTDLSTYSKESFSILWEKVDGSLAYQFKTKNGVELLLKKSDPIIAKSVETAIELPVFEIFRTTTHVFSRVLCMIMNEAQIANEENLATSDDLDLAMRFGLNYPKGPLSWINDFSKESIFKVLSNLPSYNKDEPAERYQCAQLFSKPN